eukprot:scaffold151841_cov33-Tisochrysis_lutea.AAC.5
MVLPPGIQRPPMAIGGHLDRSTLLEELRGLLSFLCHGHVKKREGKRQLGVPECPLDDEEHWRRDIISRQYYDRATSVIK